MYNWTDVVYFQGVRRIKIGKLTDIPKKRRRGKGKGKGKGKKSHKGKKRRANKNRVRRDVSSSNDTVPTVEPYFKWTRAKQIHLPKGWLNGNVSDFPVEFDYAVIELKKEISKEYMEIGVSPPKEKIPGKNHNVHFTGFDNDRVDKFVYRFCGVEEESPDLLYHYCDATQGTSGSGVYIKLYNRDLNKYENRVVALFSGHQLVRLPDGTSKSYNTAVRLTPLKFAQICYWTKGSYDDCKM